MSQCLTLVLLLHVVDTFSSALLTICLLWHSVHLCAYLWYLECQKYFLRQLNPNISSHMVLLKVWFCSCFTEREMCGLCSLSLNLSGPLQLPGQWVWQKWQFVVNGGWDCYKRHWSFCRGLWDCLLWGKPTTMPSDTLTCPRGRDKAPASTVSQPWEWTSWEGTPPAPGRPADGGPSAPWWGPCESDPPGQAAPRFLAPETLTDGESENGGLSVPSNSLQAHGLQPTRLLCPWDYPDEKTDVGGRFLLQGLFLMTQGLNPGLLHCRQILYHWATVSGCYCFKVYTF